MRKASTSTAVGFLCLLVAFSTPTLLLLEANAEAMSEQLTFNAYRDSHPSWSPDGTRIAYNAFSGSWYRNIWVMNSDGSAKDQLTTGDVIDEAPAFSPDGTMIAFTHWGYRGDYHDLMIMNANGTDVQRITFGGIPGLAEGSYEVPQWSEDGSTLLFGYGEGTTGVSKPLWVGSVGIDGSDLKVLVRGHQPRFCYGDTKILFNTDPLLGDARIAIMDSNGTNVQYLSDGPGDYAPDISAFSHRIIFTRGDVAWGPGDLYIMNADGSGLVALISDGDAHEASWSPDEEYIAYTRGVGVNYDIWKIEAPSIECTLNLMPNAGFASTTLVGSGFSHNSEVEVMWEGTTTPTVPSPLFTGSTGNFTAIISVLAQSTPGTYTVKATDQTGNSATATFTVVNMTGPQGPPGVMSGELQFPLNGLTIAASIVAIGLATFAVFRKRP